MYSGSRRRVAHFGRDGTDMLILNPTRKSKPAPCCGSCATGKPCCSKKPRRTYAPPRFERRGGLWLPSRRLATPKSLLGYPSELEWPGGRLWPGLPAMVQVIDMSACPCCGCCGFIMGSNQPDPIQASVVGTGTCSKYDRDFAMAATADEAWSSGDPFVDLCFASAALECSEATGFAYVFTIFFFESAADEWPASLDIPMTISSCDPFSLSGTVTAPAVVTENGCECTGDISATISV